MKSGERGARSAERRAEAEERRAESTERKRGGTERKLRGTESKLRQNRAETEAEIKAETRRQILKTQFGFLFTDFTETQQAAPQIALVTPLTLP